jgi:hypothetical protein
MTGGSATVKLTVCEMKVVQTSTHPQKMTVTAHKSMPSTCKDTGHFKQVSLAAAGDAVVQGCSVAWFVILQ